MVRSPDAPLPPEPMIVGRTDVRTAILAAMAPDAPEGRVLLLEGEAGTGKTSLSQWAIRRATDEGMETLYGRAWRATGSLPLGVYRDALHDRMLRRDEMPFVPDPRRASFADLVLDDDRAMPRVETVAMVERAVHYVDDLARDHGLLLVLDGMHLAAELSCEVTGQIARRLSDRRVAIIVAYQPSPPGVSGIGELCATILREGLGTRWRLAPYERDEVAQQVTFILGCAPDAAFVDAVVEASLGNPFRIREIVKDCLRRGALDRERGSWLERELPHLPHLADQTLARRDRLDAREQRVLNACAVIGNAIEPWLLAAVAGVPEAELAAIIETLREARFLIDARDADGHIVLYHRDELARGDLLAALGPMAEREFHLRALDALRRRSGIGERHLAALVYHAEGADSPEDLVRFAPVAGRHARRLGAHAEARRLFEKAGGRWSPELGPGLGATAHLYLGRTLLELDETEEARIALDRAVELGRAANWPWVAAYASALAADARWHLNDRDGVVEEMRAAESELRRAPGAERSLPRVLALLARALLREHEWTAAIATAEEGLRRCADDVITALSLRITRGAARVAAGAVEAGRRELRESIEVARTAGDTVSEIRALRDLARSYREAFDAPLDEARRLADEAVAIARQHGHAQSLLRALRVRADVAVDLGDWHAAGEDLATIRSSEPSEPLILEVRSLEARIMRRRGHLEEAVHMLVPLVEEAGQQGVEEVELEGRIALARARLCLRDAPGAMDAIRPALERWSGRLSGDEAPRGGLFLTAFDVAARSGSVELTRALAARVARSCPGPIASYVAAVAALVEFGTLDERALADAADAVARTGRRPEAARMRMVAARLASEVRPDVAGRLALPALRIYHELDAEPFVRLAGDMVRAAGMPVPKRGLRRERRGADGLTPAQQAVIRLVAEEGLSNEEIAGRLVVATSTVATHIRAILRIYAVGNRAAAAAEWRRRTGSEGTAAPPD